MFSFLVRGSRPALLNRALIMIAAIALVDWAIEGNIPLGFLYLFPMLLLGSALNRGGIIAAAALCTLLTEFFDNYDWLTPTALPRDILIFAAFVCMGLFVYESKRSRALAQRHLESIEREARTRAEAEEQLKVLVESSPAAVFTATFEGAILLANEAAHRLFGVEQGQLPGQSVHRFLPSLVNVPAPDENHAPFRTAMQCRGRRRSGEIFLADMWFSTYRTSAGSRLAAVVVDTSEDLRSREEGGLNQLLSGSRILVAAVSHEIRNVCGAIAMAHANLARKADLGDNRDFETLGNLIQALERIAALDLRRTAEEATSVDLTSLLEELRIVAQPALAEQDVELVWDIDAPLPPVWADRQSLMQVFLNLTRNAAKAMQNSENRKLFVSATVEPRRVTIRFRDTGCGVASPERLFRPFQQQSRASGLGLFLSRGFVRSFRGELRYEPEPIGSSFVVELARIPTESSDSNRYNKIHEPADSDPSGRRPQPVS
jgi:PAS domain S-box-containing protein